MCKTSRRIYRVNENYSTNKNRDTSNTAVKIIVVINVQGAAVELAHCLTRRALGAREAAGLPVQTLLCVWLPWLSSVCFVPLPPSPFPSPSPPTGHFRCGDEPPVPLH